MAKILLLEDESELREEVSEYLRSQSHHVTEVSSVRQFLQFFPHEQSDILLIDRGLPDGDGLELVQELRLKGHRCGIVVFTARDSSQDRLSGYLTGADHYITKPIRLVELGAIINAMAWRLAPVTRWSLDNAAGCLLSPSGIRIKLTSQEMQFLHIVGKQAPKPITRQAIAQAIGKDLSHYDVRNLDALVMRLRKKVAQLTLESLPLHTHHGAGYSTAENWALDRI